MSPDPIAQVPALDAFHPLMGTVSDALERDREAWRALWEEPVLRAIAYVGVPARFNPHPFAQAGLGVETCDYALHLAIVERLARGGASALMALPGSSLSTSAVLALGDDGQVASFFAPFAEAPATAFFAVTEPACGSDVGGARTLVAQGADGWSLTGEKTLVGGADRAARGLVLARRAEGGQPVLAIAGPADGTHFVAERLPAAGLAGAGLCRLRFEGLALGGSGILGEGRRHPALLALAGVLERHRPMVGAMALGTTFALIEALAAAGVARARLEPLSLSHRALHARMLRLARDRARGGAPEAHETSRFKLDAVRLVERARRAVAALAPCDALFGDARLRRLHRDAGAFEYMEGTSAIHRLGSYRAYLADRLEAAHAA